jgi:hypothetical protein
VPVCKSPELKSHPVQSKNKNKQKNTIRTEYPEKNVTGKQFNFIN